MATDARANEEQLSPKERRSMLRAFADRMLLKLSNLDDPEDLPGIERSVRSAAAIERIYSRCDRAQIHAPDPKKLEAERARNAEEAIKARVSLANTMEWGEERRIAFEARMETAQARLDAVMQTSRPDQQPDQQLIEQPAPQATPQAANPPPKTHAPRPRLKSRKPAFPQLNPIQSNVHPTAPIDPAPGPDGHITPSGP